VAKAGIPFFVEKPLSHNLDGVEDLVKLVEESNLITMTACNLRFYSSLIKVRQLLDEKAIGEVLHGYFEFGSYLPDWRPNIDYKQNYSARKDLGGGIILDDVHELDVAQWLMGKIVNVIAVKDNQAVLGIDVEESADIICKHVSGSRSVFHMDYLQRAYSRFCRIYGTKGTIEWDFKENRVRLYDADTKQWQEFKFGVYTNSLEEMYKDEMLHFLDCVKHNRQTAATVSAGARVLKVAIAVHESADENKQVEIAL